MASTVSDDREYGRAGRYLLGLGILFLTVLLSNTFWLIEHPERYFGAFRPSASLLRLELAGFVLQMAIGMWLGISLVLEVPRWRRVAVVLWPLALALYFAPLPAAQQVLTLAAAVLVAGFFFWELYRTLDEATREAD